MNVQVKHSAMDKQGLRAMRVNPEGLTLAEWLAEARAERLTPELRQAWRDGVDPAEVAL